MASSTHDTDVDVRAEVDNPDTDLFLKLLFAVAVFVVLTFVGITLWYQNTLETVHTGDVAGEVAR